jgi:hypothetical protein
MSKRRRQEPSIVPGVVLLTLAMVVIVGMFVLLGWSGRSPENHQTAVDILGSNWLEGPAAGAYIVGFLLVCGFIVRGILRSGRG